MLRACRTGPGPCVAARAYPLPQQPNQKLLLLLLRVADPEIITFCGHLEDTIDTDASSYQVPGIKKGAIPSSVDY